MGVIYEENRNINLLIREKVYRSLCAFTGAPKEDDDYNGSLEGGFAFDYKECIVYEWPPDDFLKGPCIYPGEISFTSEHDYDGMGAWITQNTKENQYGFGINFSIIVNPSKKFKRRQEREFVESMTGYLNTWFHCYPACEGIFEILGDYTCDNEHDVGEDIIGGRLNMNAIMLREYTITNYTS